MKTLKHLLAATAATLAMAAHAAAGYPTRTIQVIVPFPRARRRTTPCV